MKLFQERKGDGPPKIYKKPIVATADLHRANGEANDEDLTTNVVEILKTVPASEIQRSGFDNCLDFAVEAVRHLSQGGYVTAAEYQHFLNVKTTKGVAVHAKTDQGTLEKVCKRNMAGGCGQRKGTSSSGTSKRRMTRKVK
ncbi:hypothetical protein H0H93_005612 [Arthromyces matolae]|nr:hypothetical protein H0H93_005612 [Arthromyces matolae]